MPSPSAIAWLSRRAPVTDRDATRIDRRRGGDRRLSTLQPWPSTSSACDTDAFTTALFHEVYLGEPTHAFEELVVRRYDLFLVCGLSVPWRHDGVREFEEQRRWMHGRYLERARKSGAPWLLLEGSREARLREGGRAVDRLLAT